MRADSNLSILKEAKKNYMGQFIFSRGVGVYLLIPMPKKNTLFIFVTLPTPRADMNQSQGRLRPSLLL